ncbi:RNA polymerase sigma-70 factor, sigma-E family [Streptacidiphilus jiangxiensis]|uniref:RNA polymerase sigma-70 factor, sigma-E family n=1 Tax=Streptacidiphilus jiangxiensis TaxID=235985 RepID=A0A1H7IYH9_STRJI|nr:RNA polymerase sigma-70 factor, sigma-E family [Streptacidiphilus jiangxiensis]
MTAPFTADASRSHPGPHPHAPAGPVGVGAAGAVPTGPVTAGPVTVAVGATVDHLTETYQAHYSSLLRLAALLLDDTASCEDVVQEAFIRVHSARRRLRDPDKTLAYLRQTVVNLSRSTLRRRIMGLRLLQKPMPDAASAEEGAYDALERDELILALRGLQRRQREVLVLRYFSDMTEAQVADTLGISVGSVKAYGSRGLAALRTTMDGGAFDASATNAAQAAHASRGPGVDAPRAAVRTVRTHRTETHRAEGRQR